MVSYKAIMKISDPQAVARRVPDASGLLTLEAMLLAQERAIEIKGNKVIDLVEKSESFDKVKAQFALLRNLSMAEAHNATGKILHDFGRLGYHYILQGRRSTLSKCPVTGAITEAGVLVTGAGKNLILMHGNDPVSIAYKDYIYRVAREVKNELKNSASYVIEKKSRRAATVEVFRKHVDHIMLRHGLTKKQAMAKVSNSDKKFHKIIVGLGLGNKTTAKSNMTKVTGIKCNNVADGYNYFGVKRLEFLRSEQILYSEQFPGVDTLQCAQQVAESYCEGMKMKRDDGQAISLKKQTEAVTDDKKAKDVLLAQNFLPVVATPAHLV